VRERHWTYLEGAEGEATGGASGTSRCFKAEDASRYVPTFFAIYEERTPCRFVYAERDLKMSPRFACLRHQLLCAAFCRLRRAHESQETKEN
jgi:hypothetical protein